MKKLVNCCPHDINILNEENKIIWSLPQGEHTARCRRYEETAPEIILDDGTVVFATKKVVRREILDLPEPKEGVLYIVSKWVAEWAIGRNDLLVPNGVVKGNDGTKLGCRGLSVIWN